MQEHRDIPDRIRDQGDTWLAGYIEALKDPGSKLVQGLLLFIVLFFTHKYYIGSLLGMMVQAAAGKGTTINVDAWWEFSSLLKFFILNGWPFALIAFINKDWSSADAAKVAFAAFALACMVALYFHGLRQCSRILILSVPFLGVAALSHVVGAWRHPSNPHLDD